MIKNQECKDSLEIDTSSSKTKRKAHMDYLQDLGVELAGLSKEQLRKFVLPDNLLAAIVEMQKITANGAIRRQRQYLGKLMRTVDIQPIIETLNDLKNDSAKSTRILHECEKWREHILASDTQLETFIQAYPKCDISELRSLVRAIRKENVYHEHKHYRKLFKIIRQTIEGTNDE